MAEPADNLEQRLNALADGELDAEEARRLVEFLIARGEAAAALRAVQTMQEVTRRTRASALDATSPSLHAKITQTLLDPETQPAYSFSLTDHRTKGWRGRLLATAAGLAVGVSATYWMLRASDGARVAPGQSNIAAATQGVLPSRFVVALGRTHVNCSRLRDTLHTASFEATDANVAALVRKGMNLAADADTPDLTAVGFRFVGAGPCTHAGPGVVHLLYRSTRPGSMTAVSLFARATATTDTQMHPEQVYRIASPTSPLPSLAWHHAGVDYFLLTDDDKTSDAVLAKLHPSPGEIIDGTTLARAD